MESESKLSDRASRTQTHLSARSRCWDWLSLSGMAEQRPRYQNSPCSPLLMALGPARPLLGLCGPHKDISVMGLVCWGLTPGNMMLSSPGGLAGGWVGEPLSHTVDGMDSMGPRATPTRVSCHLGPS